MAGEWGVFDQQGGIVLLADSVIGVEYLHDYRVSTYPQEKGAFESYNKVQIPFAAKITFAIQTDRNGFLAALEAAELSLDLFVITTPDAAYPSANITHQSYRRTVRQGVTLLLVEVGFDEIRIFGTNQLSNTQSTNGQSTQDGGAVQAQDTVAQPNGGFQVTGAGNAANSFILPSDVPDTQIAGGP